MSEYTDQWDRIMTLFKAGHIPAVDFLSLTARHDKWFLDQRRTDATGLMTMDLKKYADHIEEFVVKETA